MFLRMFLISFLSALFTDVKAAILKIFCTVAYRLLLPLLTFRHSSVHNFYVLNYTSMVLYKLTDVYICDIYDLFVSHVIMSHDANFY